MNRTFRRLSFDTNEAYGTVSGAWLPTPPCIAIPYAAAHQVERYNQLIRQLDELSQLTDNWDGYGGAAIDPSALSQARRLLGAHIRNTRDLGMPEITPTANGTVALEWQEASGDALVEIGATRISGFIKPRAGNAVLLGGQGENFSEHVPTLVDACIAFDNNMAASINPVEYDLASND